MNSERLILASEFCAGHHIEVSFIESLAQHGLVTITTMEEQLAIPDTQLPSLETIFHLLGRIEALQQEMLQMQKKIGLYE
jgi:hypothetical protein